MDHLLYIGSTHFLEHTDSSPTVFPLNLTVRGEDFLLYPPSIACYRRRIDSPSVFGVSVSNRFLSVPVLESVLGVQEWEEQANH